MRGLLRDYIEIIVLTTLFSLSIVTSNFIYNPISSFKDFIVLSTQWGVVTFATFGVINLLYISRYIFIIGFPTLLVSSSIAAYFKYTQDLSLTSALFDSMINTTSSEASQLITLPLIIVIVVSLIVSILISNYRFKRGSSSKIYIHIIVVIISLGISYKINQVRYNSIYRKLPFEMVWGYREYLSDYSEIKKVRDPFPDDLKYSGSDSLIVIFVLGEAARADHFQINGYDRETSPKMMSNGIISYNNIFSEWTHTNQSVPHILTRADSVNTSPKFEEHSFIDLFNRSGFDTHWIGNQNPNAIYLPFIKESKRVTYTNGFKTVYNYSKRLDEIMLPFVKDNVDNRSGKRMIVTHKIGSHWWYDAHYPESFGKFQPVVGSKIISNSKKEGMINSYDNTILYTDHYLDEMINILKDKNSVIIYLSDHGECLGEDGKWLHSQDTIYEKNPATFVWCSEAYKNSNPEKYGMLIKNRDKFYRTDFLFHTILDLASIESSVVDRDLSLCR